MNQVMTERAFKLMAAAPVDGCLVEFGVYKGGGLSMMARAARRYLGHVPPLFGFDSFDGMPATEVALDGALASDWAENTFLDTSLEGVHHRLKSEGVTAELTKGIFGNLEPLSEYGIDKARFVHLDADIYEGYRDALRLLTPHLQVGTVILFDESVPPTDYRYQGVRFHGQRAVREWENETNFNLHLIRFVWTAALCVIVNEDYLKQYSRVISQIRRDTIWESFKNILKRALSK